MGNILVERDRKVLGDRLRSLSTSSTRKWGSMDVSGMLEHLRLSAAMALGENELPSVNKRAFQVFPLKHLILYVFPFPKDAPTAPGLKPTAIDVSSFEDKRKTLLELLERIGTGPTKGVGPEHPLFGKLTRSEWGVCTYKHTDHHLKQFGA